MKKLIILTIALYCTSQVQAQTASRLRMSILSKFSTNTGTYGNDTTIYTYSNGRGMDLKTGQPLYDSAYSSRYNTWYAAIDYDAANRPLNARVSVNGPFRSVDHYYTGTNTEPDSTITNYTNGFKSFEHFFYDANRNIVSYKYYDNNSGAKVLQNESTCTYNANNQPLVIKDGRIKTIYTYNTNNTLASTFTQDTAAGNNWYKHVFVYNTAADPIIDTMFQWKNNSWEIYLIHNNTFDAAHRLLADTIKGNRGGNIELGVRITKTYNAQGQLLTKNYEDWNPTLNVWGQTRNDSLRTYVYELHYPTTISHNSITNADLKVYPVPATNTLNIRLQQEHDNEQLTFTITDITGRQHMQWDARAGKRYDTSLPISHLPVGQYILNLNTPRGVMTRQFSIVR